MDIIDKLVDFRSFVEYSISNRLAAVIHFVLPLVVAFAMLADGLFGQVFSDQIHNYIAAGIGGYAIASVLLIRDQRYKSEREYQTRLIALMMTGYWQGAMIELDRIGDEERERGHERGRQKATEMVQKSAGHENIDLGDVEMSDKAEAVFYERNE